MGVYFSIKSSLEVLNLAPEIDEIRIVLAFINYVGQDKACSRGMRDLLSH